MKKPLGDTSVAQGPSGRRGCHGDGKMKSCNAGIIWQTAREEKTSCASCVSRTMHALARGVVNLVPPVGVVDLASPAGEVNLAPPVGVVNLAPPVGVVDLAPPVGVVDLASPVGVVNLTPPIGAFVPLFCLCPLCPCSVKRLFLECSGLFGL